MNVQVICSSGEATRIKVLIVKMLKHFLNISRNLSKDSISQVTESVI